MTLSTEEYERQMTRYVNEGQHKAWFLGFFLGVFIGANVVVLFILLGVCNG